MKKEEKLYRLSDYEKARSIESLRAALKSQPEVLFAYIYGSFIERHPFHDLDVGIYLANAREEQVTPLVMELAESLSKELRLPVDVRVLNFAPVPFVYHVIRGRLVVDKAPEVRSRLIEDVVARYLDIKPLLRRAMKESFSA